MDIEVPIKLKLQNFKIIASYSNTYGDQSTNTVVCASAIVWRMLEYNLKSLWLLGNTEKLVSVAIVTFKVGNQPIRKAKPVERMQAVMYGVEVDC